MKKLLFFLLLTVTVQVFACGGGPVVRVWSIGVIGVGNYGMTTQNWRPVFLPGIQVNRWWTQNTELRLAVEHTRYYNEPVEEQGNDILSVTGIEKRTLFRAGLERVWRLSNFFSPYAALDLAAQTKRSDLTYSGGIMGMNERNEITTKGIGLIPTLGFKTRIAHNVSFFAEYRAEAFINDVREKTIYYNGNVDSRPTHDTEADFNAGNICQAGIQFSF